MYKKIIPETGTYIRRYPRKWWQFKGQKEILWSFKDGKPHGPWKAWYNNGQLAYAWWYENGKAHGDFTWYDESGTITEVITYKVVRT